MKKRILCMALSACLVFSSIVVPQKFYAAEESLQKVSFSDEVAEDTGDCCVTAEEVEQYKADGTWEERVAFYNEIYDTAESNGKALMAESGDTGFTVPAGRGLGYDPKVYMPTKGDANVLFFLVDFPDYPHDETYDRDYVQNYLLKPLNQFYKDSSFNKLNINGTVNEWYRAKHERSYYEEQGRDALLKELIEVYDDVIDFSEYDADKNGYTDGIYLHFTGGDTGWGSLWWSYVFNTHGACIADNTTIGTCTMLHRLDAEADTIVMHETGHMLGLQDYYDSMTGDTLNEFYSTDMMYNNLGDHNAVSKYMLGWIDNPVVVTTGQAVTLTKGKNNMAIIHPRANEDPNQFFVAEFIDSSFALNTRLGLYKVRGKGGIRLWRVNAALNDEGHFKYKCDNGEVPFIQSISWKNEYNGNEVILTENYGNDEPIYLPLLYENMGEVTPYEHPSSFVYDSRDELMFTGLSVSDVKVASDGKGASFQVGMEKEIDEEKAAFSYETNYYIDNMFIATLEFPVEVTTLNWKSQYEAVSGNHTVDIEFEAAPGAGDALRCYTLYCTDIERFQLGKDYTITIPAGTFCNACGIINDDIVLRFTIPDDVKLNNKVIKKYDTTNTKDNVSELVDFDDGKKGYLAADINGNVYLYKYDEQFNEEKILMEGLNGNTRLDMFRTDDGNYLIRAIGNDVGSIFRMNHQLELTKVYEFDASSGVLQYFEKYGANGCYIDTDYMDYEDYLAGYKKVVIDDNNQVKYLASADWLFAEDIGYGQYGTYSNVYNGIRIYDGQMNVIDSFIDNKYVVWDKTEDIRALIRTAEDELAVISYKNSMTSSMEKTIRITYFDDEWNVIKRKVLVESDRFAGKPTKVVSRENGFLIICDMSYVFSAEDFGFGRSYVAATKMYMCDKDWNVESTFTLKDYEFTIFNVYEKEDSVVFDSEHAIYQYTLPKAPTFPSYEVIYDDNVAEEVIEVPVIKQKIAENTEVVISQKVPKRKGYVFVGWNTKADGTGEMFLPSTADKLVGVHVASDMTLYAQWKTACMVTYDDNVEGEEISVPIDDVEYAQDTDYVVSDDIPERQGYFFRGWNTKADGTGLSYAASTKDEPVELKLTGNIRLYAQWEKYPDAEVPRLDIAEIGNRFIKLNMQDGLAVYIAEVGSEAPNKSETHMVISADNVHIDDAVQKWISCSVDTVTIYGMQENTEYEIWVYQMEGGFLASSPVSEVMKVRTTGGQSSDEPTDVPTPEPNDVLAGDADLNGKVELGDANIVLKAALGIGEELTGNALIAADIDGTPGVALSDANMVLKIALGIPVELPKKVIEPTVATMLLKKKLGYC